MKVTVYKVNPESPKPRMYKDRQSGHVCIVHGARGASLNAYNLSTNRLVSFTVTDADVEVTSVLLET